MRNSTPDDELRAKIAAVIEQIEKADPLEWMNDSLELTACIRRSSTGVSCIHEVEALVAYGGPTIRVFANAECPGDPDELRIEASWWFSEMTERTNAPELAEAMREWAEAFAPTA